MILINKKLEVSIFYEYAIIEDQGPLQVRSQGVSYNLFSRHRFKSSILDISRK
jgi:hypothetical protein